VFGGTRLPILLLVVSLLAAVTVERLYRADRLHDEHMSVEATAVGLGNALSVAINHRMALLNGLRAFVEVSWGRPGFGADFEAYASRLMGSVPGIRAIQWVTDGVIRQTYPVTGNQRSVGYRLYDDPRPFIGDDYRRAETTNGPVISGPTELVQGGLGLIARMPARAPDGTLLAVVAVVLDLPPILSEAGLEQPQALRVALSSRTGERFFGDSALTDEDPVVIPVALAEGGWTLAAAPAMGWGAAIRSPLLGTRLILFLLVVLTTSIGWLATSRQAARVREQEERDRRLGEEKFSRLFALSPDGALLTRAANGMVLEANEGAEAVLGFSREDMLGRTTLGLEIWADRGDRERAMAIIARDGIVRNFPARFRTRTGQVREGLYSGRSIVVDGEPCLLSLFRDITDQRELEAQLSHAQKLEAVGRLAGGVAHDFNNLITAISGYGELVRGRLPVDDPRRQDVEEILKAADRAATLTQQLLAFGRRQMVQPRVVDLNLLITGLQVLLRRLVGEQVDLAVILAPDPVPVLIDPGQFEQLLVNLTINARDAMPSGGRLEIRTTVGHGESVLEVLDTGIGMSETVREQAFEPFFTTKEAGKGTGLGLATVYGIVQQAGGRIELSTAEGDGARFRIVLPRAEGSVAAVVPEPPPGLAPRGVERILLAEDDDQVRRLAERTLRAAGYQVHACADGAQALEAIRGPLGTVDLLVTDLVMPGMTGHQLAEQFRQLVPSARVLFISGYTDDYAARQGLLDVGHAFLPKPFTPAELAGRVRELLDAPPMG